LILKLDDGKTRLYKVFTGSSPKLISLITSALKPPGQSMNPEQNKDDCRHHSAKEAAALMRQPLYFLF